MHTITMSRTGAILAYLVGAAVVASPAAPTLGPAPDITRVLLVAAAALGATLMLYRAWCERMASTVKETPWATRAASATRPSRSNSR